MGFDDYDDYDGNDVYDVEPERFEPMSDYSGPDAETEDFYYTVP